MVCHDVFIVLIVFSESTIIFRKFYIHTYKPLEIYMNIPTTGNRILPIEEASAILGVSPQTLRNWEKDGRLVSERTAGGHRRYSEETIDRLKKIRMGDNEIIIPNISPSQIMKTMKSLR